MAIRIEAETAPLLAGTDGAVRVSGTRVTLDTIVHAFQRGATPQEIAERYPAVTLGDVFAVLAFYLRHQRDVDEYLQAREIEAEYIRTKIEARFPPNGMRERLLARRTAGQSRF